MRAVHGGVLQAAPSDSVPVGPVATNEFGRAVAAEYLRLLTIGIVSA